MFLVRDDSIDISTRLEALEVLPTDKSAEREALLRDIANCSELTFWDHWKIAEAADRLGIPELTKSAIHAAKDDRPLSVWEMVELAKLCRKLGEQADAEQILRELLTLPLVILTNGQDSDPMLEGIQLASDLDRELAASRLKEILLSDEIGWGSIADALGTYVELVGRDRALADAAPIIEQLSASLRNSSNSEYSGWPWHAKQLLKRGLYGDYGALLAFAENEGNRISERAGACTLVMVHAPTPSTLHSAARSVLGGLLRSEPSISEKIRVAQELRHAGCYPEMNEWLDQCFTNPPEDLEDRRTLAALLHGIGRVTEAKALAQSMDASELVKGFLFPAEKALAKSVLDDEIADDITFEQILKNDDPLDQIWRAKEFVEEHGDHRALKLISDAAAGGDDEPHRQLEAIDCLDQLGFRKNSRTLFDAMPKEGIEPYWFAAQLLRFGKKSEAAPFYIESSRMQIEYNEHLVWSGLADLGLVAELAESLSRPFLNGEGEAQN